MDGSRGIGRVIRPKGIAGISGTDPYASARILQRLRPDDLSHDDSWVPLGMLSWSEDRARMFVQIAGGLADLDGSIFSLLSRDISAIPMQVIKKLPTYPTRIRALFLEDMASAPMVR
jgi:hypothetical protein